MGRTIRHLAAARFGPTIAAAEFEKHVSIWNIEKRAMISEFDTILDYGGERLVLSHDGNLCLAASYEGRGLACYSTYDGRVVWHRKDLKGIQKVLLSSDGKKIYCGFEAHPCSIIDITNGHNISELNGVRAVYESALEEVQLLVNDEIKLIGKLRDVICSIKPETFALLSVSFGKGSLCISESAGSVRCFNTGSGAELWRYKPAEGCHVLRLGYSESLRSYVAIEYKYKTGGDMRVLRLMADSGAPSTISEIPFTAAFVFMPSDALLLTAEGTVISLTEGKIQTQIPF